MGRATGANSWRELLGVGAVEPEVDAHEEAAGVPVVELLAVLMLPPCSITKRLTA